MRNLQQASESYSSWPDTQDIVVFPSSKVGRIRRKDTFVSERSQVVGRSSTALTGSDELASRQAAFTKEWQGGVAPAEGTTLDQLLARKAPTPKLAGVQPPTKLPRSAQATGSASSGGLAAQELDLPASVSTPNKKDPGFAAELEVEQVSPSSGWTRRQSHETTNTDDDEIPEEAATKTKSKAKAKGKGQAKAKAGGGRGRPKRDLVATADVLLRKFKDASNDDDAFFGKGKTTNKKYMISLHVDLTKFVAKIDDASLFQLANSRLRRLTAVLETYKVSTTKGPAHKEFGTTMSEMLHSLQLDPPLDNDFPICLLQAHHQLKCQCASPSDFWPLLSRATLGETGLLEEEIAAEQVSIVEQRLVTIAKMQSADAVSDNIGQLTKNWAHQNEALSIAAPIVKAMDFLRALRFNSDYPQQQVEIILAQQQELEEEGVIAEFVGFPRGRNFIVRCVDQHKEHQNVGKALAEWSKIVSAARTSLTTLANMDKEKLSIFTMASWHQDFNSVCTYVRNATSSPLLYDQIESTKKHVSALSLLMRDTVVHHWHMGFLHSTESEEFQGARAMLDKFMMKSPIDDWMPDDIRDPLKQLVDAFAGKAMMSEREDHGIEVDKAKYTIALQDCGQCIPSTRLNCQLMWGLAYPHRPPSSYPSNPEHARVGKWGGGRMGGRVL